MTRQDSSHTAIVDYEYFWRDMDSCPIGRKVQLLTTGEVAVHGSITNKTKGDFLGWTPLPKIPSWMRK